MRVMDGDRVKAAVVAYSNVDKRVKSAREHMEQLQAALLNAETDSLTGILNRGGGEIKVRRLISSGSCGMFVLFDVDSFKHINDRYGHKSGDIALQKIAAALKSSTRSGDLCIRFGGDEFVVLFDGVADSKEAEAIIERLFLRVSKISIDGMPDPLSISAGATIFPANEEDSFERIYSRVDEAMYKAKKTKGNFVVFC
jgi:diguanylate cyclase (GGDEF)-like protein